MNPSLPGGSHGITLTVSLSYINVKLCNVGLLAQGTQLSEIINLTLFLIACFKKEI